MHIPYNFGHTVEKVAKLGAGSVLDLLNSDDISGPGIEWGVMNPELAADSSVGCPMYLTPQKYWPKDVAERYFGNKTVFGILRDPTERLVAMFRGDFSSYGATAHEFVDTCDVNGAIKKVMKEQIASNDPFRSGCTYLPQSEYFEGEHAIEIAVDNRNFPSSVNSVLQEHGYSDMEIKTPDIMHVVLCTEKWAGDLDTETRALVKQVYKRDFELLCEKFGYCDDNENSCIWQVPMMCPKSVLARGYRGREADMTPL